MNAELDGSRLILELGAYSGRSPAIRSFRGVLGPPPALSAGKMSEIVVLSWETRYKSCAEASRSTTLGIRQPAIFSTEMSNLRNDEVGAGGVAR
jgi:hypothetical protein